jgi:hypothetical protein
LTPVGQSSLTRSARCQGTLFDKPRAFNQTLKGFGRIEDRLTCAQLDEYQARNLSQFKNGGRFFPPTRLGNTVAHQARSQSGDILTDKYGRRYASNKTHIFVIPSAGTSVSGYSNGRPFIEPDDRIRHTQLSHAEACDYTGDIIFDQQGKITRISYKSGGYMQPADTQELRQAIAGVRQEIGANRRRVDDLGDCVDNACQSQKAGLITRNKYLRTVLEKTERVKNTSRRNLLKKFHRFLSTDLKRELSSLYENPQLNDSDLTVSL